jgi:phage gpG-like protein
MPTVVFTVTNNRIPQLIERLRDAVADAVEDTAREIETNIKVGMMEPHSGRWYGKHQASAPGEMPAIDTSALVNSIQVEPEGDLTQVVYTNQEYAVHLEYGTVRMAARPFMVPASEAASDSFERRLSDLEGRL